MADYPVLPVSVGSEEPWRDPLLKSYSLSGAFKARRLQAAKNKGFSVVHNFLTTAQKDALETFYNANRSTSFNFWWPDAPGTVYVCLFAAEDGLKWKRSKPTLWDVTVELEVI